jgi:hypothetical protein
MDEIDVEIEKAEKNMHEIVCETPHGCDSLTWPLGVPAPYKPTSRHEVLRWDYFNQTHILLGTDFETINELSGEFFSFLTCPTKNLKGLSFASQRTLSARYSRNN